MTSVGGVRITVGRCSTGIHTTSGTFRCRSAAMDWCAVDELPRGHGSIGGCMPPGEGMAVKRLTITMAAATAVIVGVVAILAIRSQARDISHAPGASSTTIPGAVTSTVILSDIGIRVDPAPDPPRVGMQQAIAVARDNVVGATVSGSPSAVYGLVSQIHDPEPGAQLPGWHCGQACLGRHLLEGDGSGDRTRHHEPGADDTVQGRDRSRRKHGLLPDGLPIQHGNDAGRVRDRRATTAGNAYPRTLGSAGSCYPGSRIVLTRRGAACRARSTPGCSLPGPMRTG